MEYVELEPKLNDFVLAAGLDWDCKCQSKMELLVLFKTRCCCYEKKKKKKFCPTVNLADASLDL